jgi:hypothetical protein
MKKLFDANGTFSYGSNVYGSVQPSVVSSPSTKVKSQGKQLNFGPLNILIPAGITDVSGCSSTSPTPATINPGSTKIKSGAAFAVLDGDSVNVSGVAGLNGGSACTLQTFSVTAKASQIKTQGN